MGISSKRSDKGGNLSDPTPWSAIPPRFYETGVIIERAYIFIINEAFMSYSHFYYKQIYSMRVPAFRPSHLAC